MDGISSQTQQIILELKNGTSDMSPLDWGFRSALARKYGISRQRISNIARDAGLVAPTWKQRARKIKRVQRVRKER